MGGGTAPHRRGWAFARWVRSGFHHVPMRGVRPPAHPHSASVVHRRNNERIWEFIGEEAPPLNHGPERDPYLEQGCHPDVVERVWNVLGAAVLPACRAQAKGIPVLADPGTGRIFALAHGTAYALWLTPEDYEVAVTAGLETERRWTGGDIIDLRVVAGDGWVWGAWHAAESDWVRRAHQAGGPNP